MSDYDKVRPTLCLESFTESSIPDFIVVCPLFSQKQEPRGFVS